MKFDTWYKVMKVFYIVLFAILFGIVILGVIMVPENFTWTIPARIVE